MVDILMAAMITDERPADTQGLQVLGTRIPLSIYLSELWDRRHFAYALAENDMRAKHMNSFLGQLWHLLNPAMMIGVYFLIFGVILSARDGVDNYVTFLVAGLMVFRFSQNTIVGGCRCIPQNLGLIRSIQFPRALVPISVLLENLMALVPALGLIVVVALIDGVTFGPRILMLPVVIALGSMFSLGIGMFGARLGSVVSDLQQVLPHFFRIMLYMSGVLFSVRDSLENELLWKLFAINPFFDLVSLGRWTITGHAVDRYVVIGLVAWAFLGLILGGAYFRRAEHRYGA
jgi:teichoic acid transport system permease protein